MTASGLKTRGQDTCKLAICAAALALLAAASASAEPAYVASTVNLRSAAGTTNEIVAKIPAGSLVDATNCSEWCEVDWQGKKGFAIASALDRSGRVPTRRAGPPRGSYAYEDDYVPVGPPAVYAPPPAYYYGYGYRPYYYGYGYRRHWRRW